MLRIRQCRWGRRRSLTFESTSVMHSMRWAETILVLAVARQTIRICHSYLKAHIPGASVLTDAQLRQYLTFYFDSRRMAA